MTTDPLIRRFNPTGPNYSPSGLDTPGRDAERREARTFTVGDEDYDFEPMIARKELVCFWSWHGKPRCKSIPKGARYMLGVGKTCGINCCQRHWDEFSKVSPT
jgi:hypothetical protein